jgi:hypothetical protein
MRRRNKTAEWRAAANKNEHGVGGGVMKGKGDPRVARTTGKREKKRGMG